MLLSSNKPFIQIGANVGGDFFTELCLKYTPSQIVIIEPFVECHSQLKECYKNFKCNVSFEQIAIIDDETKNEVELIQPTSFTAHASVNPMIGWEGKTIKVPACTINTIFDKYNLQDIGLLFIDTEGNDARIINSINFNKFNIDVLHYEYWGFEDRHYQTKHYLNGKSGMQFIENKLKDLGYKVSLNGLLDYTATKLAG